MKLWIFLFAVVLTSCRSEPVDPDKKPFYIDEQKVDEIRQLYGTNKVP